MKSDEDDPAGRYEKKTVNAINETKSAVIGTARGLWASLPDWVRGIVAAIFGLLFALLFINIALRIMVFVLETIE